MKANDLKRLASALLDGTATDLDREAIAAVLCDYARREQGIAGRPKKLPGERPDHATLVDSLLAEMATGASYLKATKIVAAKEGISLSSLRRRVMPLRQLDTHLLGRYVLLLKVFYNMDIPGYPVRVSEGRNASERYYAVDVPIEPKQAWPLVRFN